MPRNLVIPVRINWDAMVQNKQHCPIANSLTEWDDDITHPFVDRDTIAFSRRNNGMRYFYHTPTEAREFIDRCDLTPQDELVNLDGFVLVLGKPFKTIERSRRDARVINRNAALRTMGRNRTTAPVAKPTSGKAKRETVVTTSKGGKTREVARKSATPRRRAAERLPFKA